MSTTKRTLACWGVSALAVTCLFFALSHWSYMHYAISDDGIINRSFLGYAGGFPEQFLPFVHSALTWPIHWLTVTFPTVSWFSWVQLGYLWLAQTVLLKSMMQLSAHTLHSVFPGLLTGLVFLAVYTIEFSTSITFTTTTAVMSAATVCQLWHAVLASPKPFGSLLLCTLLFFLTYFLRSPSALPLAAFLALSLCGALWVRKRRQPSEPFPRGPLFRAAIVFVALFCLLSSLRTLDTRAQGQQEYMRWQDARSVVLDYQNLAAVPPEKLAAVGWTENERDIILRWYFMDENISTQAFETIAENLSQDQPANWISLLKDGKQAISRLFEKTTNARDFFLISVGMALLSLLLLWARKRLKWGDVVFPLTTVGCMFMLLLCLGVQGRLPLRAASVVLLPCTSALACHLILSLPMPHSVKPARLIPASAVCLMCILLCFTSAQTAFGFYYNPYARDMDPAQLAHARLNDYALEHEESLLVCEASLVGDNRLFPDVSEGVPKNLAFCSWAQRSQAYRQQLFAYGFDPDHFQITDFLRDGIFWVTAGDDPIPAFTGHLSEAAGTDVQPVLHYKEDGFAVFRMEPAAS